MSEHGKRRFFNDRKNRQPGKKRRWFGRNKIRSAEETQEETLDRQRSSESAKQLIESFEKHTRSYSHGHSEHHEGRTTHPLSLILTLIGAALVILITVILLFALPKTR